MSNFPQVGAFLTREWARFRLTKTDKYILFAYTIPLFVENQMNSMSNYPSSAQDVLLNLLSPIIESDAKILYTASQAEYSPKTPNASISVFLHAGQTPFTMTCYDKNTMLRWKDCLEAATVLLLPQIIFDAEKRLPDYASRIMRSAIKDEVRSWQLLPPTVGNMRDWDWLPRII